MRNVGRGVGVLDGAARLTGIGRADWPMQITLPLRWTHSLRNGCWVMGMLRIRVDASTSADILQRVSNQQLAIGPNPSTTRRTGGRRRRGTGGAPLCGRSGRRSRRARARRRRRARRSARRFVLAAVNRDRDHNHISVRRKEGSEEARDGTHDGESERAVCLAEPCVHFSLERLG